MIRFNDTTNKYELTDEFYDLCSDMEQIEEAPLYLDDVNIIWYRSEAEAEASANAHIW